MQAWPTVSQDKSTDLVEKTFPHNGHSSPDVGPREDDAEERPSLVRPDDCAESDHSRLEDLAFVDGTSERERGESSRGSEVRRDRLRLEVTTYASEKQRVSLKAVDRDNRVEGV